MWYHKYIHRHLTNKAMLFSQFISSEISDRSWNGSASQVRVVKDVVLDTVGPRCPKESRFQTFCVYRDVFHVFWKDDLDNMIISISEIFSPMIYSHPWFSLVVFRQRCGGQETIYGWGGWRWGSGCPGKLTWKPQTWRVDGSDVFPGHNLGWFCWFQPLIFSGE